MNEGVRGLGGLLLGCAGVIFAYHLRMGTLEILGVALSIGLGAPMLATGRWKNW
jgi:hypothetical protein